LLVWAKLPLGPVNNAVPTFTKRLKKCVKAEEDIFNMFIIAVLL